MLGNFIYYNPTKIYFGENSLNYLNEELPKYGKNVLLIYGGGSIKKNGIYDSVTAILKANGKNIIEDAGVMPNPTLDKLLDGCEKARTGKADFILAVGGGSVCDYAKALSASVNCEDDPWEKYFIRRELPDCKGLPIGCVLTMAGTGSEMNDGCVLTNAEKKLKYGFAFGEGFYPEFSILDPTYTFSLPKYQMTAGIFDIMSHVLEQYLSGDDDNTSDYLSEGLLRSLIVSARAAVKDPMNYEARSNIMWAATWALNNLLSRGKTTDWQTHNFGHAISAVTDATHGMTLACATIPYFRHIMLHGVARFRRYAINVWDVDPAGKTNEQIADEGLTRMESFMREIGLILNSRELGLTEDLLEAAVEATRINTGGYKVLDRDEVRSILKATMK